VHRTEGIKIFTKNNEVLENVTINKIYPHHAKALQIAAGIATKIFPTFTQSLPIE
jgi:hypothetical protein